MAPRPFLALMAFGIGFTAFSLLTIGLIVGSISPVTTSGATYGSDPVRVCIGVLSSIVGSVQTASGYCAQRLGHQLDFCRDEGRPDGVSAYRTHEIPARRRRASPLVAIGVLLLACGTISAVVNLGILEQSTTAPFAALTLATYGLLACTVLREPVTTLDKIAIALVLLGVGVAALGAGMTEHSNAPPSLTTVKELLLRSALPMQYSVAVAILVLTPCWMVQRFNLQHSAWGLWCYAVGAGALGGFSSSFVKITVEIAKRAVESHESDDLDDPFTYVFALGVPVCVLAQLQVVTLGLQRFGTLKFVPCYHVFIVVSNIANGLVLFDEAQGHNRCSASLFGAGCGLAVLGVLLLLVKAAHTGDELLENIDEIDDSLWLLTSDCSDGNESVATEATGGEALPGIGV